MRREIEQAQREILEVRQAIENEQRQDLQPELPFREEKPVEIAKEEQPEAREQAARQEARPEPAREEMRQPEQVARQPEQESKPQARPEAREAAREPEAHKRSASDLLEKARKPHLETEDRKLTASDLLNCKLVSREKGLNREEDRLER